MALQHDIFLSSCGSQKDFVEQLFVDLERDGLHPFFDQGSNCLPIGESFSELIFHAIKCCQVGVVVLSEEYFTRSKWSMLELNALVTAQKENRDLKILPVFLGDSLIQQCLDESRIRQWELRWHEWAEFDTRINVEGWKRAIKVLLRTNVLRFNGNTSKVQIRKEIVKAICRVLPPPNSSIGWISQPTMALEHDIFLSFSGSQVDFVEQLFVDLERDGVYPFFDRDFNCLPIGESFSELILHAIRCCQVGVVVLSEEYFTRSCWTMLELDALVTAQEENRDLKILPVFLGDSFQQCRDESRIRQWELRWHDWAQVNTTINVEDWKRAFKVLLRTDGLSFNGNTSKVQIRKEIVKAICTVLLPPNTSIGDLYIEGKSRLCQVIREKINTVRESASYGVRVVGIYGVGGSGKTTLCKALCDEFYAEFHGRVCYADLGENNEVGLLRDMLVRLAPNTRKDVDFLNADQCREHLMRITRRRRVLITLDNVSDSLTIMERAMRYLGSGYTERSIIIVTARSHSTLQALKISESDCMEMPALQEAEATSLFMHHADLHTHEGNKEIIVQEVELCRFNEGNGSGQLYHPLALKALGSRVRERHEFVEAEEREFTVANEIGNGEHLVFPILRKNFEELSASDQRMFLDVALSHPGNNESHWAGEYMFQWLSMIHQISVEDVKFKLWNLKRKSLIEVDEYGSTKIRIHDLSRKFALVETTRLGSEQHKKQIKRGPSYSLFFNTFKGLMGTASPSRPAVATFQGSLYCLYCGYDNEIWWTSTPSKLDNLDYDWTVRENVGENFPSIDGPALASYDDHLVSVIRGKDGGLYWNKFDGSRWRGYEPLKGWDGYEPVNNLYGAPALAVYKNNLYCCIRKGEISGKLCWAKLVGNEWLAISDVYLPENVLGFGPSLFVFNDQLVCTVQGVSDPVYYTTFDGEHWSGFRKTYDSFFSGEEGLFFCGEQGSKLCYKKGVDFEMGGELRFIWRPDIVKMAEENLKSGASKKVALDTGDDLFHPGDGENVESNKKMKGVDSSMIEERIAAGSLDHKACKDTLPGVDSMKPQWVEDLKSLISTTMLSLGIRQTPTIIDGGADQLVQLFQKNSKGILAGRLDTTMNEIQIILLDLETMLDITGVGLKTDKFILVTLGGAHVPSEAVMSVLEENDFEKFNSSGDAFYLLQLTEDLYKEDYHASELLQGNHSSRTAYCFHIVAKLLLLMKCEDLEDETFWLKIKDFSLDWNWQDLKIAMTQCERIWNLINSNDVQCQQRGGTEHGGSGSGGSRQHSSSSSSHGRNNGEGIINVNQDGKGNHDENKKGGGDDRNEQKSFSSSVDPVESESYTIQVRPGCVAFEEKHWVYKSINASITPFITITFKTGVPFRNCSDHVIKGREIQVKLDVNFGLGDCEPKHVEENKFAWFHDFFEFSFRPPSDKEVALLKPCSGIVHEVRDQKTIRGTGSTFNSAQWNAQGHVGVNIGHSGVARADANATVSRLGPTTTIHTEESIETAKTQTLQGFDIVEKFGEGIGAKFIYGDIKKIPSLCLREDGTCAGHHLPVCSSQMLSIGGTFLPSEDEKTYYAYMFQCERHLKGWFWNEPKATETHSKYSLLKCFCPGVGINNESEEQSTDMRNLWSLMTCKQKFDIEIKINHSMNHLRKLAHENPGGIPAIGTEQGYESVMWAEIIDDTSDDTSKLQLLQ